ncbi:hypothetical protein JW911_05300 [Candidatus Peregrinibacteria bacterium]|nr:hypothetical protein [Candidatus Peregrinibacteria bacterium]
MDKKNPKKGKKGVVVTAVLALVLIGSFVTASVLDPGWFQGSMDRISRTLGFKKEVQIKAQDVKADPVDVIKKDYAKLKNFNLTKSSDKTEAMKVISEMSAEYGKLEKAASQKYLNNFAIKADIAQKAANTRVMDAVTKELKAVTYEKADTVTRAIKTSKAASGSVSFIPDADTEITSIDLVFYNADFDADNVFFTINDQEVASDYAMSDGIATYTFERPYTVKTQGAMFEVKVYEADGGITNLAGADFALYDATTTDEAFVVEAAL